MKATRLIGTRIMVFGAASVLCIAVGLCAEPPESEATNAKSNVSQGSKSNVEDKARVSVVVARDRAQLMHDLYAATLDVMHERYFHGDRAIVPARALEDVFSEIKRRSHVDARWISVNLKAMSLNHEPTSDFEKRAAKEIANGKAELEIVEDGYYRRAGAIRLGDGCISCHLGFSQDISKTPRFVGLVISVPINSDSGESK